MDNKLHSAGGCRDSAELLYDFVTYGCGDIYEFLFDIAEGMLLQE